MADRESTLAIVIRTVDKATAGFAKINTAIAVLTAPISLVREKLSGLWKEGGGQALVDGFKGVGTAVGDLFKKLAIGAGVVALATRGVLGLVDEFDKLGDTSEKLGVNVDFLAAMRFAAERSGASVESLDQGLTSFGENMGQLRAGTGGMLKFLTQISPALVTQLKATKGNESAFRLLADAMAAIEDPQKRMALAAKVGLGSELVPMLARGSRGLLDLQGEFSGVAGSMETSAEAAGKTDDALKNLHASTMGIKAALLTGLAPALTIVVEKLTRWFVDHREDVKRWAIDIGEKLPGAVDNVVIAISKAVGWVTKIVDGIGGLQTVAILAAAALVGPLIKAFVALGIVLLTNPLGLILTTIGLITVGIIELIKHIDDLGDALAKVFSEVDVMPGFEDRARAKKLALANRPSIGDLGLNMSAAANIATANSTVKVKVDFANAPKGMRATVDPQSPFNVDLTVGHQMFGL